MKIKKPVLLTGISLLAGVVMFNACQKDIQNSQLNARNSLDSKVGKMDVPDITCGDPTQTSINIVVTAGSNTGAPAGFSIQWMPKATFDVTGWPDDTTLYCKASFSGNASDSRYNLQPGQSVTINIGELLLDNGASTNCPDGLKCGTDYVFRVFAHANSSYNRSDFSPTLTCSTLPCGCKANCTLTQGFWKTHGPSPKGNNKNVWPATSLILGNVSYTDVQLQSILNAAPKGNGLISLAHQLIAAKLNIAKGADPSAIQSAVDAADALIGNLVIPPVGSGSLKPSATGNLTGTLASYNEGAIGPGHCTQ